MALQDGAADLMVGAGDELTWVRKGDSPFRASGNSLDASETFDPRREKKFDPVDYSVQLQLSMANSGASPTISQISDSQLSDSQMLSDSQIMGSEADVVPSKVIVRIVDNSDREKNFRVERDRPLQVAIQQFLLLQSISTDNFPWASVSVTNHTQGGALAIDKSLAVLNVQDYDTLYVELPEVASTPVEKSSFPSIPGALPPPVDDTGSLWSPLRACLAQPHRPLKVAQHYLLRIPSTNFPTSSIPMAHFPGRTREPQKHQHQNRCKIRGCHQLRYKRRNGHEPYLSPDS